MAEFTDYIVFERPGGKEVRIGFEIYYNEILYHFFEYRHNDQSEWKGLKKGDDGYFTYSVINESGVEEEHKIKFPTDFEINEAKDVINKKYNILSV